jgi:DEAD/DEAH box helicase domain-containing protein
VPPPAGGGSQDEVKPLGGKPRPTAEGREEVLPDAAAMVARLKRMREQRERREPRPRPAPRVAANGSFEPRFHPGDQIICSPYGAGEVLESRVEEERELLLVAFPEHGELTIDAAVSAARLADDAPPPEETDF